MSENSHAIFPVPCQDLKVVVWCALSERKIISPLINYSPTNAGR